MLSCLTYILLLGALLTFFPDQHVRQPYEMFVTSSGTTTDFETYEFDVFTKQLVVAGYVTGNESISIAEVSATT